MCLEKLLMLVRVVFLKKKKKPTPDNLLGLNGSFGFHSQLAGPVALGPVVAHDVQKHVKE